MTELIITLKDGVIITGKYSWGQFKVMWLTGCYIEDARPIASIQLADHPQRLVLGD